MDAWISEHCEHRRSHSSGQSASALSNASRPAQGGIKLGHVASVAQIFNLLYRRFPTCRGVGSNVLRS